MTHDATPRLSNHGCNPRAATPERLRHWSDARALLGVTIRGMAELTGINRGDLSKIENGIAAPTPDQARRILFVVDAFRQGLDGGR